VAVFYVTNRRHEVEEVTRQNLEKLGFPLDPTRDSIFTRGEREWQESDKGSRRREVASKYRVLLLIGDNLGDFVSGSQAPLETRDSLHQEYEAYWGTRWIVLPNPQYGSWEGAILGFDYRLSDQERLRRKYETLKTR
jgi:acid phosphatase